MGIQDRDYYREGPSFLDRVGQQGAIVWLIAITIGIFVGEFLTIPPLQPGQRAGGNEIFRSMLVTNGAFDHEKILQGEVWRLLTSVFLHGGITHIIFNMLALYWAGQRLEELYGSLEFVLFYLFAGVGANLIYLAVYLAGLCPAGQAIGASGAVVAVLVVFALHFPRARVLLFFAIPMPAWGLVVLFVALDFFGALGMRGGGIAYIVHLGGAFCGLLYHQSGVRFSKLFARRPRNRVRPRLRVVPPPVEEQTPEPVGAPVQAPAKPAEAADEQLEAKLDAVLAKVSKYGQESLTPEEREILFRASELYKKKRK